MTHIALLRAVNLGGHNKVAMANLRALFEELGLQDARTVLQSGNVVFRPNTAAAARLERLLERETARRLGVQTDFFVRTEADWKALVAGNPFPKEAARDPAHLLVMFLKAAPDRTRVAALQRAIPGREVVRASGRELYAVYPDGIGRSRLTAARMEKTLGTRGTARNWNTVMKLGALAGVS